MAGVSHCPYDCPPPGRDVDPFHPHHLLGRTAKLRQRFGLSCKGTQQLCADRSGNGDPSWGDQRVEAVQLGEHAHGGNVGQGHLHRQQGLDFIPRRDPGNHRQGGIDLRLQGQVVSCGLECRQKAEDLGIDEGARGGAEDCLDLSQPASSVCGSPSTGRP
jgi:hypothetical protein